jgi:hypothetical protein
MQLFPLKTIIVYFFILDLFRTRKESNYWMMMLDHTSPTCMLEEVSVFSNENKNEFRENKKSSERRIMNFIHK